MNSPPVKNFRVQDGCHNCRRIFRKHDYDEGYSYFCTQRGLPRPLCGSSAMNEVHWFITVTHGDKRFLRDRPKAIAARHCDRWHEWSTKREVDPFGICDEWKRANKEPA